MPAVDAQYHPSTYSEFFEPLDLTHAGFTLQLLEDFKRYQSSQRSDLPDYFGYDSDYGWPAEIAGCLQHIHLCIPPNAFDPRRPQAYRKCRREDPQNDIALVYAQGLYETHRYSLIGLFAPDAHGKCKEQSLMLRLGRLGRRFRNDN